MSFRSLLLALLVVVGGLLLLSLPLHRKEPITSNPSVNGNKAPASAGLASSKLLSSPLSSPGESLPRETIPIAYAPQIKISEPAFLAFNDWAENYWNASPAIQSAMVEKGIELARERRAELSDMIQSDPERAIQLAFPRRQRPLLPPQVRDLLETPVRGRGDLFVLGAIPAEGETVKPLTRTVEVNGGLFDAFVYGRRLDEPTRTNLVLHGIAIDRNLAVYEYPLRPLGPDETAELKHAPLASALCQVSGQPADEGTDETFLESDEEIIPVCSGAHALKLQQELAEAEAANGFAQASVANSVYTEGYKTLLIIRIDFQDLAGEPFSPTEATNLVNGLDKFYREMSYNKAGFKHMGEGSAVTPTFRMPKTAAYYGANDASILRKDARAAASAAGYVLGNYEFDLVCFGNVPGFGFAGLGYVGAPGAWIRGTSSVGVCAHELGHNFGLNHANFWETSGASVIGGGISVEYGDKFDTMGSAGAGSKHFNARYKSYLNWLETSAVRNVTASGTYRLFPHDDPGATGIRALRVIKNAATNYWVEYRAKYAGNKWLANGVGLRWARSGNQSSLLLDVTPGSPEGKDDAALLVGRTFSDAAAGVHITPVAVNANPPSIDVVINRGTFPNNLPPTLLLQSGATNALPNSPLVFTAIAVDPEADPLAYFWDFGDGSINSNSASQSHKWASTGEYLVQCTVTDMKGGTTTASQLVRIGNPSTYRIGGRIMAGEQPLAGVRVSVSSTRVAYTDSDGRYTITGLPSGTYNVQCTLEGFVFSRYGFSNPLFVGPSTDTADFYALVSNSQTMIPVVPAGAIWKFRDNGANLGTAWRALSYPDSDWSEGAAPLGYGDNEKTGLNFGPDPNNKYLTTYFRHKFVVEDRTSIIGLTLGLRRDDGGVVYLNNREVFRSNMPGGTILFNTTASSTLGGSDETTFFETDLEPGLLVNGTNVLAVEIHQGSRTSTDIVFDLRLQAVTSVDLPPPNLSLSFSSNATLRIDWPDTPFQWEILSAGELTQTEWVPVNVPVQLVNGRRVATVPFTGGEQYFKLRKK